MKLPKPLSIINKVAILAALLALFAFAIPKADDPLDKLVAALQKWVGDNPQEKIYLQFDKPYYAIGDTVWFKGYLTVGSRHQLSAISGSMYVDLITERDSIVKSLKLPVTGGMAIGDFLLDDELKPGNYRIRAYTQWMRNAGEDYFFDKTLTVGSVFNNDIVTRATYAYRDVDGKQMLTALLNYKDEQGKPIADRSVLYRIVIDKNVVWTKRGKTDAMGNVLVDIANDKKADLTGAYISTVFDKSDGKTITRDFPIKARLSQSDVQFFPEGGNLVNGIISRVGFKALGVDGLGISVGGAIVDNDNKQVAELITTHAGMGSFTLKPEAGKTYTAKIKFTDGSTKDMSLPKAISDGYTLSVYQPTKDSILVRISASAGMFGQDVNFIAHTNGEVAAATIIKINKPVTAIWVQKKAFPTGIAQFTIFNAEGVPLNERIAFIRSDDLMELNIKTAKSSYNSKEAVFMSLQAKDGAGKPTIGNFSVSVIDETQVPVKELEENTILTNLLLTSDIKGYVEQPNYYFTKVNDEVNQALDNLMLTQGYRKFTWKELIVPTAANNPIIQQSNNKSPKLLAEGLGVNITGYVQTLGNKPLPGASVMLMALKAGVNKVTTADSLGRFRFDGIFMTDSIKFTVQARTVKNSDKLKIFLDTLPKLKLAKNPNAGDISTDINGTLQAYIDAGKKQDEVNEKIGRMDRVHRLRQVNIKASKPKGEELALQFGPKIPEGAANKTIFFTENEKSPLLGVALAGRLGAVVFKNYKPTPNDPEVMMYPFISRRGGLSPVRIVLNGRLLDPSDAAGVFDNTTIDIGDIAKVEFIDHNPALGAILGTGETAILIYTRANAARGQYNPSIVNVTPKGFNKVREFYLPRYDRPSMERQIPDMRSTVYWNPYLKTNAEGKLDFGYFNADGPGTYKVVVEGLNADGQLGRQVFRYTVEGEPMNITMSQPLTLKDDGIRQIANRLDTLAKKMPVEKVYLHTDKAYYNIGDTLWFKSYVTDASQLPSKQSALLYVELDDDSTEAVRRVTINIKDGVGWGQIPLPRAIFHEGGYTLRAYTNWMQNFGADAFFTQRFYLGVPAQTAWLVKSTATIKQVEDKNQLDVDIKLNRGDRSALALRDVEVKIYEGRYYLMKDQMRTGIDGSLKFSKLLKDKVDGRNLRVQITSLEKADNGKVVQVPLQINRPQKIDLQFLPEGGNLVAGLKSTIGFKAIGEDGKGINVTGTILDSKGVNVGGFISMYGGMGSFDFTPKAGETYTAKITQPTEAANVYKLPAAMATGTVMHINNPDEGDQLTVSLSGLEKIGADSTLYLIGTNSGRLYYSEKVAAGKTEIAVSKDLFSSGITRFTLLKGKQPLNERAVFIDHKDQLNVKVKSNKQVYNQRESVDLEVEVTTKSGVPVQGNFSLAVTDNSQVKADTMGNNQIATSLLLNSGLKGHVENPGYYTNRKDKMAWQALDNLMLTQGWTGYDWKDVFGQLKEPKFVAERDFKITGNVVNAFNKPVANAPIIISSQKPSFITQAMTDGEGKFTFKNLPTIDSGSFFLQGANAKGKNLTFGAINVNRFKAPAVPAMTVNSIMPWYVNTDTVQLRYVARLAQKADFSNIKGEGTMLRNVNIKTGKVIKNSLNPYGPGKSDLSFDEKDIKASGATNLWQLLKQKLPGLELTVPSMVEFTGIKGITPGFKFGKYYLSSKPRGAGSPVYPDVKIDGFPLTIPGDTTPIVELSEIMIANLTGFEIIYSKKFTNSSIQGSRGRAIPGYRDYEYAKIEITTANGVGWFTNRTPGTATYRPLPILLPQQFYTPKYKPNAPIVGEPDYRATIFWEPNLFTDANGKAKVTFSTSDLPKDYSVNVQGITPDGYIGSLMMKLPQKSATTKPGSD